MIPLGCVTGRFQPVHRQHIDLFEIALGRCAHIAVAVTNPDAGARHEEATSAHRHTAAANPFTYYERARLIDVALRAQGLAGRFTVVPFDLTRPEQWPEYVPLSAHHFVRAYSDWERQKARWLEQAGYAVTVIDGDVAQQMSATTIRADLQAGGTAWQGKVPTAVIPLLVELLEQTPMRERV